MQLLKFGIALPAGVALLAADLFTAGRKVRWPRGAGALLGGFALVEAAWAAVAFALLPPARAGELLWPAFMVGSYQAYVSAADTYLGAFFAWHDPRWFLESQLPLAVAAALALSVAARWIFRWARERNGFGLAAVPFRKIARSLPAIGDARQTGWACFLTVYFCAAVLSVGYAHWVGAQSEWMLAAAALPGLILGFPAAPTAGAMQGEPKIGAHRAGVIIVWLAFFPSAIAGLRQLQPPGDAEARQPRIFANGERLWLSPASHAAFDAVQKTLTQLAPGRTPMVFAVPMASGWHHYFDYGLPAGTRHRWIMAGWVPRAEEPGILAALAAADALIFTSRDLVAHPVGPDPGTWRGGHNPGFSHETNAAFRRRLAEPIPIDDRLTVFPVRR